MLTRIAVGQLPFESKVTKQTEYVPVVAGLVGGAGTDPSSPGKVDLLIGCRR